MHVYPDATDKILAKYKRRGIKLGKGTRGYVFELPELTIIKNITGTMGWIGSIKANHKTIDGNSVEDVIAKYDERGTSNED